MVNQMQDNYVNEVAKAIMQQIPPDQAEIKPFLWAFFQCYNSIKQMALNIEHLGWILSVQDVVVALPQQNNFLGFRVIVQIQTPVTRDAPQMIAEIPLIYKPLDSVTGGVISMRNIDVAVCPDRLLGDLDFYSRHFRDGIVNYVRKVMIATGEEVRKHQQGYQSSVQFSTQSVPVSKPPSSSSQPAPAAPPPQPQPMSSVSRPQPNQPSSSSSSKIKRPIGQPPIVKALAADELERQLTNTYNTKRIPKTLDGQ